MNLNKANEKEKKEYILENAKLKLEKIQHQISKPVTQDSPSANNTVQRTQSVCSNSLTKRALSLNQATGKTKKSRQWNPSTLLTEN